MEALDNDLADQTVENFYYLSRAALVKDERHLDKFDQRVRRHVFKGLESLLADARHEPNIPEEWLKKRWSINTLTEDEKKQIEAHRWLGQAHGDAAQAPRGAEGSASGRQQVDRHGWHLALSAQRATIRPACASARRENRNFRAAQGVGQARVQGPRRTRSSSASATSRWRCAACASSRAPVRRTNSISTRTIKKTARNQGYLDLQMRPERRNAVKVLLFFDIGGSMDSHIAMCEELFSAAKTEFKHMEYFYFHNCLYESVWKDNRRRFTDRTPTWDVMHKYAHDYKIIFVGDASMSPYEINMPGGSVEHVNEEAGSVWMDRITKLYPHAVWLNPVAQKHWSYSESITIIKKAMNDRMFPLTIDGLEGAMKELVR
jgi:uncharacterized protein with von Willebrand factor type A (vWA) domain